MIGRCSYSFVILCSILLISSSGGRSDRRAGANGMESTCSECHQNSNGNGLARLIGISESIKTDSVYRLQLIIEDTEAFEAGFQITAVNNDHFQNLGTFTAGNNSRLIPGGSAAGRLTHSSPKQFENGQAIFEFDWQAPSTIEDEIIFYYAAVAANDNGANTGDKVYLGNSGALLSAQNDISLHDQITIYPNPIKTGQNIYIEASTSNLILQLQIFDINGKEIHIEKNMQNKKSITAPIAGVYILRILKSDRRAISQKMIVL